MDAARPLSPEIEANLRDLEAHEHEPIDLTEMPEITDFSGFRRGVVHEALLRAESVRLDRHVIGWFRAHTPEGEDYTARINAVLGEYVAKAGEREAA